MPYLVVSRINLGRRFLDYTNAFGPLLNRSPIGWLRERDIDLLLCSELCVEGALRDHFAAVWGKTQLDYERSWVSHNDFDGESDLVIAFSESGSPMILLVENKIAASFQPDQTLRYCARAKRWEETIPGASVQTVLIAPEDYFSRTGSEVFNHHISYQEIMSVLTASTDPRSIFLSRALQDGIDAYRQGYVAIPNEAVSDIWTTIWRLAGTETPMLRMSKPNPKPGGSTFIYFRQASGFSAIDVRRATVVLKAAHGNADLQFRNTDPADLEKAVAKLMEPDMTVTKAAKSASIRINVPKIDFGRPADDQIEKIKECLMQAERLRMFFTDNQPLALLSDNR